MLMAISGTWLAVCLAGRLPGWSAAWLVQLGVGRRRRRRRLVSFQQFGLPTADRRLVLTSEIKIKRVS